MSAIGAKRTRTVSDLRPLSLSAFDGAALTIRLRTEGPERQYSRITNVDLASQEPEFQELKLSPAVAERAANYSHQEPVPVGETELVALESLNDWLVSSKLLPKPVAIKDHVASVGR